MSKNLAHGIIKRSERTASLLASMRTELKDHEQELGSWYNKA